MDCTTAVNLIRGHAPDMTAVEAERFFLQLKLEVLTQAAKKRDQKSSWMTCEAEALLAACPHAIVRMRFFVAALGGQQLA